MEAFGEIGLLPSNFYQMRYNDYLLLQQGFANGRVYDRKVLRKAVAKLLEPYVKVGKILNEFMIWWEPGDTEEQRELSMFISEQNMKRLKEFKEKEAGQKPKEN